ncbi:MAG TPA: molybdate ABC transporter permease subunit [Casimicrobiaceae bacterium]|jgi:molybdate transport system permease protein
MSSVLIPLLLTLKVAVSATLIACALGIAAGYWLARTRMPGRDTADALLILPLVLPPTVLGYYLLVVFGRSSALGAWLEGTLGIHLIFTWEGAALAAAIVAFPLVFKASRAAFEAVDPTLEKAGRALGYSGWTIFARVTLPLAWRGVIAGAMLAFARAMGEFGATLMVAGNIPGRTQTVSIAIYEAVNAGDDNLAGVLVAIVSLVCVTLLVAANLLARRGHMRVASV